MYAAKVPILERGGEGKDVRIKRRSLHRRKLASWKNATSCLPLSLIKGEVGDSVQGNARKKLVRERKRN